MNRRPLRFAAVLYAAGVLWLTIGPAPWSTDGHEVAGGILSPAAWTSPITWSTGYFAEIAFNVMLFIPVGVLAALLLHRRRWPLALFAGFAFTAGIELVQLVLPDRVSDPRDLVLNTIGSTVGVGLVMAARGVRRSTAVIRPAATSGTAPSAGGSTADAARLAHDDPSAAAAAPVRASFDELVAAGDRAA
ncbi:glycopeptide antibiotics resistance protein [Agromyces terreus]|uniref:Glycopeptide antibiotics resistance protein n=1 Tax=Agromyces terreus TaxID=424795 RepID=A0A9X2H559_9MICO|nr:VanZ family protein [Agromyces terreus]MCP2370967.1 glycopeptide antibiotics resistance protein [Agromyces terreus]